MNLGFNVRRTKDGDPQGQLQVGGPGNRTFHGDTVTSLRREGETVVWTDGRKDDTFGIEVRDRTGRVVFTTTGAQKVQGGNITVH